ncbi:hypothetical protein LCGC14_0116380 [marine sediment metagenome]|uniref:Uncharacterized protein n=1 Tax=marine sediment metagenome TaxID=412755 RepID=A0A0F9XPQ3_9ZZZZ
MNDHEIQNPEQGDSHLDAFAAVSFILIAVLTAVFWVSTQ